MSHNSKYALTEILICGDCGTPYKRVTWSKRGKTKTVWRCINRLDHGTKYCKDSPTIEESKLHDAIVKALNTMMPEREYMMDTLQQNMQIVLADNSNEINPFSIENAIKEREKAIIDLVAVGVKTGNVEVFDGKFKEISDDIKVHKKTLDQYKAKRQTASSLDRQMDDICETLGRLSLAVTEYDDPTVRQLINTIKVMSEDKLLIIFKGGFEMEQMM